MAYIPEGKTVSDGDLEKCFEKNGDSIGYMFANAGKLFVRKFLDFDVFLNQYKAEKEAFPVPFAVHFRIKTSGKIDLENCHPFPIGRDFALMHNGIIAGLGNAEKSDTNQFASEVLLPMLQKYPGILEDKIFRGIIASAIGTYNKLILMKRDGSAYIVHEKQGDWIGGVWFSNKLWTYSYSQTYAAYETGAFFKRQQTPAIPHYNPPKGAFPELPCTVCGVLTRRANMICRHCMECL